MVTKVDHGVFLAANSEPTRNRRLQAYLQVLPAGTLVDSVTALQMYGVDVGSQAPARFCSRATYQSRRKAVRIRRVQVLPPANKCVVLPLPALVAARHDLSLVELVAAGDWMVHLGLASLSEVAAALSSATGRDCRRSRRAAELVRERVDSPQETRLRLLVVFSGLPEPACNIEIGGERFFIAKVDLYLRRWNIVLEYEGDQHRSDDNQWTHDIGRYEDLAAAGHIVIRVTKQTMRRPRDLVWRIHRALVSRGYDGPLPQFGAEWAEAFGRRPR